MGALDTAPSSARAVSTGTFAPALWLLPAGVIGAAVVARMHTLSNTDVSWLLTLAEKVFDGRNDFIEINPPGAILTYVPAVWLARLTGIPAEFALEALVFLLAAVTGASAGALLGRTVAGRHHLPLLAAGFVAIALILPSYTFGEREHIGSLLLLPWIAALVLRIDGATPALMPRICAGLACGACAVIKPHFAVTIAVVTLFVAWRTRAWRALFATENWTIAGVLAIYAAVLWAAFPDFLLRTAPIVATLYVPDRLGLATLLWLPGTTLWLCIVALVAAAGGLRGRDPLRDLLLIASAVSFGTYLLQGKGWPYHTYPAISFAMLALLLQVTRIERPERSRLLRAFPAIAGVLVLAGGIHWFNVDNPRDVRALARAIERVHPQPSIAVITGDMAIGFPVTRMVGGTWAQGPAYLWMALGSLRLKQRAATTPERVAALERYEALDRTMLRADISRNRPDILLIEDGVWLPWARQDPALARVLDEYERVTQIDDVQIWRRRQAPSTGSDR